MGSKRDAFEQNYLNLGYKKSFFSINYKSVIKNLFYIALYFILIICFTIIAHVPKMIMFINENLSSSYILIIILSLILNLIVFTEIISVRIKWNTLFFSCSRDISWKQTLKEYLFLILIFTYTMVRTVTDTAVIVANSFISHYNTTFWTNPHLADTALIFMTILFVFNFEMCFWFFILFDKFFDFLVRKGFLTRQGKDLTK